jgi:hypothetical protein
MTQNTTPVGGLTKRTRERHFANYQMAQFARLTQDLDPEETAWAAWEMAWNSEDFEIDIKHVDWALGWLTSYREHLERKTRRGRRSRSA